MKINNVYIKNTACVCGPIEAKGPLVNYFDKSYKNYYMDIDYELSEVKLQNDSIDILLNKEKIKAYDVDLMVSGDLLNQITASCYANKKYERPFLGLFSACATSIENIIVASSFIDNKKFDNAVVTVSSHNLAAEKQFRNPVEYGAPKKISQTFTATGAVSIFLTNKPTSIKIDSFTIGKVIDMNQKNVNDMGSVMAGAACDTIYRHLKENGKNISDYDLILTGDLGIYGKDIFKDYMLSNYNIAVGDNYNDCGVMLYDLKKQKEITAGGSGPVCSALVNFGYVYSLLKKKKIKRVLFAATGALFSSTFAYQKQNLLSICHVIEVTSL